MDYSAEYQAVYSMPDESYRGLEHRRVSSNMDRRYTVTSTDRCTEMMALLDKMSVEPRVPGPADVGRRAGICKSSAKRWVDIWKQVRGLQ